MICLLLTLFISLFSIGSPVYPVVESKENNITLNDKKPVSNLGVLDEYGTQLFYSTGDLSSTDFIINFIQGIAGTEGSEYYNIGFGYTSTYSVTFSNLNTEFIQVTESVAYRNRSIAPVTSITLNKYATNVFTYEGETIREFSYLLTFYSNNTTYLSYNYWVSVPLLDDAAHELGYTVIRTDVNTYGHFTGNSAWWAYYENTLDGFCPLYTYHYDPYITNKTNTVNDNYNRGYKDGESKGYQNGVTDTLNQMGEYNTTALTIFNGIFDVGLLPVNVFLTIFNFELFGVNIAGIISGLLTLSVVIIIVRFLLGGKKDD